MTSGPKPITVWEGNAPKVHLQIQEETLAGLVDLDLTSMTFLGYIKDSPDDTDAGNSKGSFTVIDAEKGQVDWLLATSDVPAPGRYWCRIDAIKSGSPVTVHVSSFIVKNG